MGSKERRTGGSLQMLLVMSHLLITIFEPLLAGTSVEHLVKIDSGVEVCGHVVNYYY